MNGYRWNTDAAAHGRANWPLNTPIENDPGCRRHTWGSQHPNGANFAMFDGTVRFFNDNIESNPEAAICNINPGAHAGFVYQNLYFINDGLVVRLD